MKSCKPLTSAFLLFSIVFMGLFGSTPTMAQDSPVGLWKTIDDNTKEAKSIVEISEVDGKLVGKIIKLFKKPEEDANPKCDQCQGDLKDQPIIGMKIIWDIEKRSSDWGNGHILDPKNGKTYKAKMKVVEDGKKLELRGFLGISLLGRTQVWQRE
jgi:uncharacterized protein (DUF2147 family)